VIFEASILAILILVILLSPMRAIGRIHVVIFPASRPVILHPSIKLESRRLVAGLNIPRKRGRIVPSAANIRERIHPIVPLGSDHPGSVGSVC
jgi:hypothetical protein